MPLVHNIGVKTPDVTSTMKPALADTLDRALDLVLRDSVSVKDFGALGNYNTTTQTGADDTAAFQAAIDSLGPTYRNGGMRQIRVPAGTYLITALVLPAVLSFGVEFVGEGIMSTHIRSPKSNTSPLFTVNIEFVRFRNISFYGSTTDNDVSTPANWKQTCYFGKLGWNAADLDVSFINCKFSMFVDAIEGHGRGIVTDGCIFAGVTNEMHVVADPDIIWVPGSASNSQYTGARHYTMRNGRSDATSRVLLITGTATWKHYIHDVMLIGNDYAVVDRLVDAQDATLRRVIIANNNSILSFRGGVIQAKGLNVFSITGNSFNSAYDDTVNPSSASDCISHLILGANSLFAGTVSSNTMKCLRTNFIETTSGSNIVITNNVFPSAWILPANTDHYVYFSGTDCPGLVIDNNVFQAASTSGNYHLFSTAQVNKSTSIGTNPSPWGWDTEALTYTPVVSSSTGTWVTSGKYTVSGGYCTVDYVLIGTGLTDTTGNIAVTLPITAVPSSRLSSYSGGGGVYKLDGFSNTGASMLAGTVSAGTAFVFNRSTNLISTVLSWADRASSTVGIMGSIRYKV